MCFITPTVAAGWLAGSTARRWPIDWPVLAHDIMPTRLAWFLKGKHSFAEWNNCPNG